MGRIASFHLVREAGSRTLFALTRMATDRPRLARVDGLAFWRLLGTGRRAETGPGSELRRTALFALWENEAAFDRFVASHAIARRWADHPEAWHVRLRALGGHGRWRGVDVLDGMEHGQASGPVAIITRADVRRQAWRDFRQAGREVDAELRRAPGLLDVVGIGEAPAGRLATFSLWRSLTDARHFAYAMPRHAQVIRQTREHGWYSEELFARFEPYASTGAWDGRDPLA